MDISAMIEYAITDSAFIPIIEEAFSYIESVNPEKYEKLMNEISIIVYGQHFNEYTLTEAVNSMKNTDGTTGGKWTVAETTPLSLIDFSTKNYNEYDFNYICNMAWSDFSELLGTDVQNYIMYAKLWLEDPDGGEDRAYKYYTRIIKGECDNG